MSESLVKVCQGTIERLQVNLPPRHGKTTLIAHWLPFFYLAAFPDRKIIYATHSEASAREHGEAARNLIARYGRLFGIGLGRHAALDFQVADLKTGRLTGGGMKSVGVCTGIHGKGANLAIVDDLYGNLADAASLANRDSVWRWLTGSLMTRLANISAVVSIGTPFMADDHFGRFQASEELGGDRWTRLRLPALAEAGDPLLRTEGAALWPDMFPAERLQQIKANLIAAGQYRDWAAQYELTPVFGDGISDWDATYFDDVLADEIPPGERVRVLSLDPSKGRDARAGDYAAWTDATLVNRTVYCWSDLRRVPMEQLEDVTVGMMQVNQYHGVVIESNGFQEMIALNVLRKALARGIHTPVYNHLNTTPKLVRIRAGVGPLLQQKRLKLVPSPGRTLLLAQLKGFPNGHDDGPDSVELAQQILLQLITKNPPSGGMTLVKVR